MLKNNRFFGLNGGRRCTRLYNSYQINLEYLVQSLDTCANRLEFRTLWHRPDPGRTYSTFSSVLNFTSYGGIEYPDFGIRFRPTVSETGPGCVAHHLAIVGPPAELPATAAGPCEIVSGWHARPIRPG